MTLLEGLVAIAILGGGVLTMIFAMSGGALAVKENGEEATLQNLARSQMEYIKNYAYNPCAHHLSRDQRAGQVTASRSG